MKTKYPRADALRVAKVICDALKPVTERLIVAGSLRRRKEAVGDVEILYVPKIGLAKGGDLFESPKNLADLAIDDLERRYVLGRRVNAIGSETFGARNKLMFHRMSGVPVDLFEATAENWFNYLVCRTGPAESNMRICSEALSRGWRWKPYSSGFVKLLPGSDWDAEQRPALAALSESPVDFISVGSEREVFEFVGLPYKEPWER